MGPAPGAGRFQRSTIAAAAVLTGRGRVMAEKRPARPCAGARQVHHAIERAGFLFPRQQAAVHWSVTQLIGSLSGRTDLALTDLRQRLRDRLDRKT